MASRFISRVAKTKNLVPQSIFALKPNGNTSYAGSPTCACMSYSSLFKSYAYICMWIRRKFEKINVQGLVWRLNVSWIWWFYETFWDLAEKSRHSPFLVNWKCWKCQSNGVAVQTVWWLLPFLDLLQFLLLLQGCFFQPTKSTDDAHCLLT